MEQDRKIKSKFNNIKLLEQKILSYNIEEREKNEIIGQVAAMEQRNEEYISKWSSKNNSSRKYVCQKSSFHPLLQIFTVAVVAFLMSRC